MPCLVVLSDIHGNLPALQAVLADVDRRTGGRDVQVVTLGDHLSGPLWPEETAAFLRQQSDWVQIAGNHERQLLDFDPVRRGPSDRYAHACLSADTRNWLTALPASHWLTPRILLCHGTPDSDLMYWMETVDATAPDGLRPATQTEIRTRSGGVTADLVLCGHTHVPRCIRLEGGPLIVNPGSVGLPAYSDDHPVPHRVATGSPDARYALLEPTAAGWCVSLISLPYDFEPAARQADRNDRPDWAQALRSGTL